MRPAGFERWTRSGPGVDSEKTPTTFYLRKTEFMLTFPNAEFGRKPESGSSPWPEQKERIFSLDSA